MKHIQRSEVLTYVLFTIRFYIRTINLVFPNPYLRMIFIHILFAVTQALVNYNPSIYTLQWRHNERDGVSNHRCLDCLFNRFFRRRSKTTSKLHVTGLCEGIYRWPVNSPQKGPVTRTMFPFDNVIMMLLYFYIYFLQSLAISFLNTKGHVGHNSFQDLDQSWWLILNHAHATIVG